jgi:hypothetical protein
MREVRHTYIVLVGKREAKGPIGTSVRRWKIGMDVEKARCQDME